MIFKQMTRNKVIQTILFQKRVMREDNSWIIFFARLKGFRYFSFLNLNN